MSEHGEVGYFNGVLIIADKNMPLTTTDPVTGEEVDVGWWSIGDGRIYMHPDRYREWRRWAAAWRR